jgi:transcription antitermination factor NusG
VRELCPKIAKMPQNAFNFADDAALWYAVQVKTTHEKRVAWQLDQRLIEHFLPLYRERRRWSDRIKELELPLFPGYVFCRFTLRTRATVLKTPGVHRVVGIGSMPAPIEDHEIASIQEAQRSGLGVRPHPFLRNGQRVRVEGGPFKGLEGFITDIRRRDRLILSINLLHRSIALEIDGAWVTPIPLSSLNRVGSPSADQARRRRRIPA